MEVRFYSYKTKKFKHLSVEKKELIEFLNMHGLKFPAGATIQYIESVNRLVMKNIPSQHELLHHLLEYGFSDKASLSVEALVFTSDKQWETLPRRIDLENECQLIKSSKQQLKLKQSIDIEGISLSYQYERFFQRISLKQPGEEIRQLPFLANKDIIIRLSGDRFMLIKLREMK